MQNHRLYQRGIGGGRQIESIKAIPAFMNFL